MPMRAFYRRRRGITETKEKEKEAASEKYR